MKRFLRIVSLILVFSLILAVPAFAAEVGLSRSLFFARTSQYIDVDGKNLEIWFDVTGVEIMDTLGADIVKVQRSADGETWTTVATYDSDDYPEMLRSNTCIHASYLTYTASSGYRYRARVDYYAKKGQNIGGVTQYTSSVSIP